MKRIVVVVVLLGAGLMTATGLVRISKKTGVNRKMPRAKPQLNVKALPAHGLDMFGPADPSYGGLVEALSRGNPDAAMIEVLRPYSVFVRNNTSRAVVACALKWEMTRADGMTRAETSSFVATWRLMEQGAAGAGSLIIAPGAGWFFAPRNIEITQGVSAETGSLPSGQHSSNPVLMRALAGYAAEATSDLAQYTDMTVSIDGAFFDDGTFVGPDTTEFFAAVKAMRDARRDLFEELARDLKGGGSADEAFKRAETLASDPAPRTAGGSTASEVYAREKREAAREVLRIKNGANVVKALEFIERQSSKPRLRLKKVTSP